MHGRTGSSDRAVSTVVGVVLLIGMIVMVMAVLGSQILGVGLFDRQPRAELVYEERSDDELIIGVEDATALSADDTRISLESGDECRGWPGSGDIESGDTVRIDTTHCSFTEDDVVQVIGSSSLLDTYRIRGVGLDTDFNCAVDGDIEDADDTVVDADANDIDIKSGSTIKCDFSEGSDGRNFDIDSGGLLVGDVVTADGNHVMSNATTDGYVNASGIELYDNSTLTEPGYADGDFYVDGESTVEGPVLATGDIQIYGGSTVEGKIYTDDADNKVDVSANSSHGGIEELDDADAIEDKFEEVK